VLERLVEVFAHGYVAFGILAGGLFIINVTEFETEDDDDDVGQDFGSQVLRLSHPHVGEAYTNQTVEGVLLPLHDESRVVVIAPGHQEVKHDEGIDKAFGTHYLSIRHEFERQPQKRIPVAPSLTVDNEAADER